MTGLERLRSIIEGIDHTPYMGAITGALYEVASQIEREQAEDHEIAEWVRECGGFELVRTRDEFATDMICWIRRTSEIPEEEDVDVDKAMSDIDDRLMPCGMKWPRFEDGTKVVHGSELPEFLCTPYRTVRTVSFRENGNVVLENGGGSVNIEVLVKSGDRVANVDISTECDTLTSDDTGNEVLVSDCDKVKQDVDKIGTDMELTDSWDQIYEDCELTGEQYVSLRLDEQPDDMTPEMAMCYDLVRRTEAVTRKEYVKGTDGKEVD